MPSGESVYLTSRTAQKIVDSLLKVLRGHTFEQEEGSQLRIISTLVGTGVEFTTLGDMTTVHIYTNNGNTTLTMGKPGSWVKFRFQQGQVEITRSTFGSKKLIFRVGTPN